MMLRLSAPPEEVQHIKQICNIEHLQFPLRQGDNFPLMKLPTYPVPRFPLPHLVVALQDI